jgi:hypothetical protein
MISSSQNATFEHCISHWMPRPCVSAGRTSIKSAIKSAARESPQAHSGCILGHSKTGCLDTITVGKITSFDSNPKNEPVGSTGSIS